ncbi:lipoprotein [Spiroplasma endosymbiont of Seladonia tumulorum]|uniref:lipoprotein n=1 Tax=Spiroplasma endosymbiont of Seladonia tumulorum TaxID=3066321 RepID=UPI0030CE25AA
MKKILSIIGAISLIGTPTFNLISCNPNIEQCHKETIGDFERICYREEKFNVADNKWYIIIAKLNLEDNWEIFKFQNKEIKTNYIFGTSNSKISIVCWLTNNVNDIKRKYYTIGLINSNGDWNNVSSWERGVSNFKGIYQYLGNDEPNLPKIDKEGNLKVKE